MEPPGLSGRLQGVWASERCQGGTAPVTPTAEPLDWATHPVIQGRMTSCLLVKSKKRLVAVADGRLSRDDTSQSFNATRKLRRFEVAYQIPEFDRGRFLGSGLIV